MFIVIYNDTNAAPEVRSTVIFDRAEADKLAELYNSAMKPQFQNFSVWTIQPAPVQGKWWIVRLRFPGNQVQAVHVFAPNAEQAIVDAQQKSPGWRSLVSFKEAD